MALLAGQSQKPGNHATQHDITIYAMPALEVHTNLILRSTMNDTEDAPLAANL